MRAILPGLLSALLTARTIDLSSSVGYGIWRPDGSAPHRSWHEALLGVAQDRPDGHVETAEDELRAAARYKASGPESRTQKTSRTGLAGRKPLCITPRHVHLAGQTASAALVASRASNSDYRSELEEKPQSGAVLVSRRLRRAAAWVILCQAIPGSTGRWRQVQIVA